MKSQTKDSEGAVMALIDVSEDVGDHARSIAFADPLRDPRRLPPGARESYVHRLDATRELAAAIQQGALTAAYQPILDLRSNRTWGHEILARWKHPVRGLLTAGEFIDVAASAGLLLDVTNQVIGSAMAELARPDSSLQRVAVNMSGRELNNAHFVTSLLHRIEHHGVLPDQIVIEVTESMRLSSEAFENLSAFAQNGLMIAADDFGTGYASFDLVRRAPLDILKIDKSLLAEVDREETARRITSSIAQLAHDLGLRVIGEGVERRTQLECLHDIGVDAAQGFLLGRPGPHPVPCRPHR